MTILSLALRTEVHRGGAICLKSHREEREKLAWSLTYMPCASPQ